MGRYIDFIFQKSLHYYRLLVTQINVETSAKLFHKILREMNWSPIPMDVTLIPSLCFISFSYIDINFDGKNVSHSNVEQTSMAFLHSHAHLKSTHKAKKAQVDIVCLEVSIALNLVGGSKTAF